jgi:hypothetical protein
MLVRTVSGDAFRIDTIDFFRPGCVQDLGVVIDDPSKNFAPPAWCEVIGIPPR